MQNVITVKQDFPLRCKKSFSSGVIVLTKIGTSEKGIKLVDKIFDIHRVRTKQTKILIAIIILN